MKRILSLFLLALLLTGCVRKAPAADVVATTRPVYDLTVQLCRGSGLQVERLVTENVSCLHDYTLQVRQMQMLEDAGLVVCSGGGLEAFLDGAIPPGKALCDASAHVALHHSHHDHDTHDAHHHEEDPHIWLSPENAMEMAEAICAGLAGQFPEHAGVFSCNLKDLLSQLEVLQAYGEAELGSLRCRQLLTFHDGFSYFAEAFGLEILHSVEEESGSEASAKLLMQLAELVRQHRLPAIFTEVNGATAAAQVIAREAGIDMYALDMAMGDRDYFSAMYHNIDTLKEALG